MANQSNQLGLGREPPPLSRSDFNMIPLVRCNAQQVQVRPDPCQKLFAVLRSAKIGVMECAMMECAMSFDAKELQRVISNLSNAIESANKSRNGGVKAEAEEASAVLSVAKIIAAAKDDHDDAARSMTSLVASREKSMVERTTCTKMAIGRYGRRRSEAVTALKLAVLDMVHDMVHEIDPVDIRIILKPRDALECVAVWFKQKDTHRAVRALHWFTQRDPGMIRCAFDVLLETDDTDDTEAAENLIKKFVVPVTVTAKQISDIVDLHETWVKLLRLEAPDALAGFVLAAFLRTVRDARHWRTRQSLYDIFIITFRVRHVTTDAYWLVVQALEKFLHHGVTVLPEYLASPVMELLELLKKLLLQGFSARAAEALGAAEGVARARDIMARARFLWDLLVVGIMYTRPVRMRKYALEHLRNMLTDAPALRVRVSKILVDSGGALLAGVLDPPARAFLCALMGSNDNEGCEAAQLLRDLLMGLALELPEDGPLRDAVDAHYEKDYVAKTVAKEVAKEVAKDKCCVCFEAATSFRCSAFRCPHGRKVCGSCADKIVACPLCRKSLVKGVKRKR